MHEPLPKSATVEQPGFFRSIAGYFRGWRYRSQSVLLCFAAMYLGWIMLADPHAIATRPLDVAIALIAATALVIAIFLINDAADRDIDAIVHPERPIPRGEAHWRHVYGFGIGLIALGMVLASTLSLQYLAATSIEVALVLSYYGYFKRSAAFPAASELVAPMIGATLPLSAFAFIAAPPRDLLLISMAFVYLADMAQDLLGGIHDEAGDRRFHVRTFTVSFGAHAARIVSVTAFAAALVAGSVLWWRGGLGWIYAAVFVTLSAVMLVQYARVFTADGATLETRAGRANHLGGAYYFVVSAALFPDALLRAWLA